MNLLLKSALISPKKWITDGKPQHRLIDRHLQCIHTSLEGNDVVFVLMIDPEKLTNFCFFFLSQIFQFAIWKVEITQIRPHSLVSKADSQEQCLYGCAERSYDYSSCFSGKIRYWVIFRPDLIFFLDFSALPYLPSLLVCLTSTAWPWLPQDLLTTDTTLYPTNLST